MPFIFFLASQCPSTFLNSVLNYFPSSSQKLKTIVLSQAIWIASQMSKRSVALRKLFYFKTRRIFIEKKNILFHKSQTFVYVSRIEKLHLGEEEQKKNPVPRERKSVMWEKENSQAIGVILSSKPSEDKSLCIKSESNHVFFFHCSTRQHLKK